MPRAGRTGALSVTISPGICSGHYIPDKHCWLLLGFGVVPGPSRNQAGDEGAQQGFAASASVVHELEKAEIERQLVLREAPVRA